MDAIWLWVPVTILAAAFQTGRNATQRSLTGVLGTLGATQVRFLFGFPFACVFLAIVLWVSPQALPGVNLSFLGAILIGALAQIGATALMLAAMQQRTFVTVTAWVKTEPIQVALFGALVLGDALSWPTVGAILLASAGVLLMSKVSAGAMRGGGDWRPVAFGLCSGALFAVSAIGFRGAILSLPAGSFVLNATWSLVWSLGLQVLVLLGWMVLCNRQLLHACLRAWRPSIPGGFLGAAASQCWFLAFALTSAANVRTLGLIEVLFAQLVTRQWLAQSPTRGERIGVVLIVLGVALLVSQGSAQ